MERAQSRLHQFIGATAAFGMLLVMAPVFFAIAITQGPRAEVALFPVVTDMQVTRQMRDGDGVLFRVQGERQRGYCQPESITALATMKGLPPEMVLITFPTSAYHASAIKPVSRPEGFQSFGEWRIAPLNKGDSVTVVLRHSCHSLWDVVTKLGPWEVTQ